MGDAAEGKNIAHQVKKMNMDGVRHIRDRFNVPVSDADIEKLPYITFPEGSEEHTYLHAQRQKLHGYLPSRQPNFTEKLCSCRACKTSARCWKSRAKRSLPLSLSFVL